LFFLHIFVQCGSVRYQLSTSSLPYAFLQSMLQILLTDLLD
jgi:hypothetical protein